METNPKFNQKTQEKAFKNHKNLKTSTKITSGKASGPCQGSKWAKTAQKEVATQNLGGPLGSPWGPQNHQKLKKMMSKKQ